MPQSPAHSRCWHLHQSCVRDEERRARPVGRCRHETYEAPEWRLEGTGWSGFCALSRPQSETSSCPVAKSNRRGSEDCIRCNDRTANFRHCIRWQHLSDITPAPIAQSQREADGDRATRSVRIGGSTQRSQSQRNDNRENTRNARAKANCCFPLSQLLAPLPEKASMVKVSSHVNRGIVVPDQKELLKASREQGSVTEMINMTRVRTVTRPQSLFVSCVTCLVEASWGAPQYALWCHSK